MGVNIITCFFKVYLHVVQFCLFTSASLLWVPLCVHFFLFSPPSTRTQSVSSARLGSLDTQSQQIVLSCPVKPSRTQGRPREAPKKAIPLRPRRRVGGAGGGGRPFPRRKRPRSPDLSGPFAAPIHCGELRPGGVVASRVPAGRSRRGGRGRGLRGRRKGGE